MAEAEQRGKVNVEDGALVSTDFEGEWRMAQAFSKSTIVPKPYQNHPEDILVAWQYGGELGLGRMQSLQSIAVINNKPTLPGETLLALAYSSGELEDFEETWDSLKKVATCTVKRKGRKPIKHTFSWADAERIKTYEHGQQVTLASKDTYKNYPQRMCTMRARGFALKDAFADRVKGMKTSEEAEEIHDEETLAAKARVIPDLEKKTTESTDRLATEQFVGGVSGDSTASVSDESGDGAPGDTTVRPEPTQEPEKPKPQALTVESVIERINALTVENFDKQEPIILGKEVFGKFTNNDEKLALTLAVNRKRRELFPR